MRKEITLQLGLILEIQDAPDETSTQVVVHVHEVGFDAMHVEQTDDGKWRITSVGGGLFDELIMRKIGCVPPQVYLKMYADYLGQTLQKVEERMGGYLDEVKDKRRRVVIGEGDEQ